MSKKVYKNPPLIQVMVEFSFIIQNPDITIPGVIYEKLKERFPHKTVEIPLSLQTRFEQGKIFQEFALDYSVARFSSEDGRVAIRVGPNLLGIHLLNEYTGWENFKKMIMELLNLYADLAEIQGLKQATLKYVNAFESEDMIGFRVEIPEGLRNKEKLASALIRIPYGEKGSALSMHLLYMEKIILSLDYTGNDIKLEAYSKENILSTIDQWLEEAHLEIENAFEECITDVARERFGVEKEEV